MIIWVSKSSLGSSVYSCDLFLISSASVRSIQFMSFIVSIFAWNVPLITNFLEEISSLSILLFSSISLHCSHKKAFIPLRAILRNSAFKWVFLSFSSLPFAFLLFSAICKASSNNHYACLFFFFLGMLLITTSCTILWTSIHSSSGTPSDLIPWIYWSLPLCNKGFDISPTFFRLKLNFAIRSSWSEPAHALVFADCIERLHQQLQRM